MTDTILMFLITTCSALFGAVLKTVYDSKCRRCKFGCIEVERDINAEVELEEHNEIRRGRSDATSLGAGDAKI